MTLTIEEIDTLISYTLDHIARNGTEDREREILDKLYDLKYCAWGPATAGSNNTEDKPTLWELRFYSHSPNKKIAVIKTIKTYMDWGLKETKYFVEKKSARMISEYHATCAVDELPYGLQLAGAGLGDYYTYVKFDNYARAHDLMEALRACDPGCDVEVEEF